MGLLGFLGISWICLGVPLGFLGVLLKLIRSFSWELMVNVWTILGLSPFVGFSWPNLPNSILAPVLDSLSFQFEVPGSVSFWRRLLGCPCSEDSQVPSTSRRFSLVFLGLILGISTHLVSPCSAFRMSPVLLLSGHLCHLGSFLEPARTL